MGIVTLHVRGGWWLNSWFFVPSGFESLKPLFSSVFLLWSNERCISGRTDAGAHHFLPILFFLVFPPSVSAVSAMFLGCFCAGARHFLLFILFFVFSLLLVLLFLR